MVDSSVDSVSVSGSGSTTVGALDCMRAAAAWLSAAGAPPSKQLLAVRAPAAKSSLLAFKDYQRSRSMAHSPLMVSFSATFTPTNLLYEQFTVLLCNASTEVLS